MSTYLVTGASGFVGARLTQRLRREGHSVRVLARAEARDHEQHAEQHTTQHAARDAEQHAAQDTEQDAEHAAGPNAALDVRRASLGDPDALAEAARGVDVLYHCAAENSPRAAAHAFAWINVAGTENVLNAAREAGVRRVIHLSCTDAALANRDRLSWKETQQLGEQPLDGLCRSKLLAEELALQANRGSLEVCVVRPAWVWGPGDRRTLPALCREDAHGGVQLCGDGNNLVPTVYIDNLVAALLLAASSPRAPGHAYHVLDGEVLSAREFFDQLCKSLGLGRPKRGIYAVAYARAWLRERLGLPGLSRADVARRGRSALFDGVAAVHDLGYEAKISVERGMAELAAWASQLGGPAGIAKSERSPASAADIQALMRLADST